MFFDTADGLVAFTSDYLVISDDSASVPVHTLTLTPDRLNIVTGGPVDMIMKVSLANFQAVNHFEQAFQTTIDVCTLETFAASSVADQTYGVRETDLIVVVPSFTQTPNCEMSDSAAYTAFVSVDSGAYVQLTTTSIPFAFNSATRSVRVTSDDPDDATHSYVVKIVGTLDGVSDELTFPTIITCDCKCNVISITS